MGLEYEKIDYTGIDTGNWNDADYQVMREKMQRVVMGMTAKGMTVTIGEIKPGCTVGPHKHPHEQIAIIVQGTCDYYVDGKPVQMKPGSWVVVPPNVEHYIHVFNSIEPVLNLDIFTPGRPEYVESYSNFLAELDK